jgi:RNA polymerase sigma-70 factor (ECF subfamily)
VRPGPATGGVEAVEMVFREEYHRIIAALTRRFGSIDVAEEAASEALIRAVTVWPEEGTPPNPGGWLTTTAHRAAIDRLRRERRGVDLMIEADGSRVAPDGEPPPLITDDQLRLVFTCCHPALAPEARVALSLRLLGGLTVAEVAAAYLVPERTMAQRITRAKRKIAAARIPYRVPEGAELPARIDDVAGVVYLIFNAGYLAAGEEAVRVDLCEEAIRLGRILVMLLPGEFELQGLLALMLLSHGRRRARSADAGPETGAILVPLPDQDRSLWDRKMIAEGHAIVRRCLAAAAAGQSRVGRYQVQAAIGAVHTDAARAADTDWGQVLELYDQLWLLDPTPVVALNRAVAVAEFRGPEAALAIVDTIELDGYEVYHAVRGDLLLRNGNRAGAGAEFGRAAELARNPAERAHLERRARECRD